MGFCVRFTFVCDGSLAEKGRERESKRAFWVRGSAPSSAGRGGKEGIIM